MKIKTLFISFLALTSVLSPLFSQPIPGYLFDTRADSIAIPHQDIHLNITDFSGKSVFGYSNIRYRALVNNIQTIRLDLLDFTVDSVISGSSHLTFLHADSVLKVQLPAAIQAGDTGSIRVYYRGYPHTGAGSFGGFYWTSGYAFNLGVSLNDVPHNAGRFWFPCFDNFVTRSTYDVYIEVDTSNTALCGGNLISVDTNANLRTFHWSLNTPVPSYLVSVAVNKYSIAHDIYNSLNGPVPVTLAALASDTAMMKNSFVNLHQAGHIYEDKYGPYEWSRIGYVLVPFNSGAMEHATNIAYPRILTTFGTQYETVMAHELSHHWWGDYITCQTAEDMWINEGSAVFSEYVFLEELYGASRELTEFRKNHLNVLQTAHVDDNGYWPISGIPQAYTYGTTSYVKGANVIRSLRAYMNNDSLFYHASRTLLDSMALKDVNALTYRDIFSAASGINLTEFFNDWVFNPGFTELNIDSVQIVNEAPGSYAVTVYTRQKVHECPQLYSHVPLNITFLSQDLTKYKVRHEHYGETSSMTYVLPFMPVGIFLNEDEEVAMAVTSNTLNIKNSNTVNSTYSYTKVTGTSVTDSAYVRTEMHWVSPDQPDAGSGILISPGRFWNVFILGNSSDQIDIQFPYDGNTASNPCFEEGIVASEDSMILVYRKNAGEKWRMWTDYSLFKGNATDKRGFLTAKSAISGEYALASRNGISSVQSSLTPDIQVYPNPSNGCMNIKTNPGFPVKAFIYNSDGKICGMKYISNNQLDLTDLPNGTYIVEWIVNNQKSGSQKVLISR